MYYNQTPTLHVGRLLILVSVFFVVSLCRPVMAEETDNPDQPLSEADLLTLESSLQELKALAPELRVLLRKLRTQVGFDPREVHRIERSVSQSQKDLERLIAMTKRKAFNPMRAHFMADDLRRKSQELNESLAYVGERTQAAAAGQGDAALQENEQILLGLLNRYSEVVSENVALLQDRGM